MPDNDYSFNELLITKKMLDGALEDDKPDGFVLKGFYNKRTLKLEMMSVSIKTKGKKKIAFLGERYEKFGPKVNIKSVAKDNIVNYDVSFPDSFVYETEVTESGSRFDSRFFLDPNKMQG